MNNVVTLLLFSGLAASAQTITQTFGSGANAFSIDFVQIGNPGNSPDSGTDSMLNAYTAGAVSYVYNLGKYEISRGQIQKANASGGLGITLYDMTNLGGNELNGLSRPATGVSWNEAARFVNYLNTSQGYQAAYNFTTSGVNDNITLWGAGQYSGSNQFRHKDAYYFLPSMDEWYKAAYGSPSGTWYNYATGSDSAPSAVASGTSGAVYNGQSGPADITNAGGLSPYGTIGQGGNVWEWNESAYDGSNNSETESRIFRGGSWVDSNDKLAAGYIGQGNPVSESYSIGFRVASLPEPSSISLFLAGGAVLMAGRRRV